MGLRTPQRTVIHTCVCCIPRCCSVSICITCMGETGCNANILTTNTVYDSCTCQKLPWNFNKSYLHHQWQTSLSWNNFKVYTSLMLTSWKSSITTPAVHRSIYKIKPNLVTSKSWIRKQHYDQLTRRVSSHGLSYKGTNYWKMLNCLKFHGKAYANPVHSTQSPLWLVLQKPCISKQWHKINNQLTCCCMSLILTCYWWCFRIIVCRQINKTDTDR